MLSKPFTMIPRGQLDISYAALFKGFRYCIAELAGFKSGYKPISNNTTITCLSVRTGLDLTLTALNLSPGSEILISNINIPDMFSIIAAHELKAVPLAIDKRSLNLSVTEAEALISPATKAILITHLFGAVTATDGLINLAKLHNLIVIEDCAQAFDGSYTGNPKSDVVLFSFGLIKTNTSLTGAVLRINNTSLYQKISAGNDLLPVQDTKLYLKKIGKGLVVKLITSRWCYTLLYQCSQWMGRNFDEVLAGFTKGFPGADVMAKIRFRPGPANVRLLEERLIHFDKRKIDKRTRLASGILEDIPAQRKIGYLNPLHTHWVLPVFSADPEKLVSQLRKRGIDATSKASSLVKLPGDAPASENELDLDNLVYLPVADYSLPAMGS